MNIVILDDVESHNVMLRHMIENIQAESRLELQVVLATTQWEDVLAYAKVRHPQTLYLLDIELNSSQNGLEVCKSLQNTQSGDHFIFASAYPHHSFDCLKCHAYDFLLKPFSQLELKESLVALMNEVRSRSKGSTVEVHIGSRTVYLSDDEILYLEAMGKNLCAHTLRGDFSWRCSLKQLASSLSPEQYVQVHRNYVVNRRFIEEYDADGDAVRVHGHVLPVSRRMRKNLERRDGQ